MANVGEKVCTRCHALKSFSCFHRDRTKPGGLHSYCKPCRSIIASTSTANREWRKINQPKIAAYNVEYRRANPNKVKEWDSNRDKTARNLQRMKRHKERMQTDIPYRLRKILRDRIYRFVKNKPLSFQDAFGCDYIEFKLYIENQWITGMSWENYGKVWHIDHILPLAGYNLEDPTEYQEACNYLNLQPLYVADNLKKGATQPHGYEEVYYR